MMRRFYRSVLTAVREQKVVPEQARWLQQFQWDRLKSQYGESLMKQMEDSGLFVFPFPTHEEEWNQNKDQPLKANRQNPVAKIKAVEKGPNSNTGASDKAGGLLRTVHLCKTAKFMLTCNLNVTAGLFNGACGTVVDIVYQNGHKRPDCFPDAVKVHFPGYTGPVFIEEVVPIVPVTRKIDCRCHCCFRKQVPLRLGWATTIHRCQGMTAGLGEPHRYKVIHPDTRAFESRNPGALYVAQSRAKCRGVGDAEPDFAWNANVRVNEDGLCHVVNTCKARNQQIKLLEDLAADTRNKFCHLVENTEFIDHDKNLIKGLNEE